MTSKQTYLAVYLLLAFGAVNGAILFWGPKEIQIPALKEFDNDDLTNLLKEFDNPQMITFRSKSVAAANSINEHLTNHGTAYVPNTKINIEADRELTGNQNVDSSTIQEVLKHAKNSSNSIVALIIEGDRIKRELDNAAPVPIESTEAPKMESLGDPVLYSAPLPKNNNLEAMIYSSRPLLLKTNASHYIYLGNTPFVTADVRDTYTRLVAKISNENNTVNLRFKFPLVNGYWYLTSVEVEFIGEHPKQYNLTLNQEVSASRRFSYHCGGHIVFTDTENNIELYLYEVQAQPDAYLHRFSDAYNCVPFMTGPLWSGLLVTFILGIGLAVGLTALGSIKTMDKFDTQKTKQLSITVWE